MIPQRTIESDCFGEVPTRNNINSKKKGNGNERNACKSMREWVGQKFCRVPQSGAIRRVNVEGVVADIMPDTTDESFVWSYVVETKALKKLTVPRILPNNAKLFTIWNQCITDARRAVKIPIALLRSNGMSAGEYYLVLEASLGGRLLALAVPPLFSGSNHTHSLIGFLFSDVKRLCQFKSWDRAVRASNLIKNSKIFV